MESNDADAIIMLSSQKIAEVMEDFFNKKMLKEKITIVDLQPTRDGYAFSIAYVASPRRKEAPVAALYIHHADGTKTPIKPMEPLPPEPMAQRPPNGTRGGASHSRDTKGRFTTAPTKEGQASPRKEG